MIKTIRTIKVFSLLMMFAILGACGHSFTSVKNKLLNENKQTFNAQIVLPEAKNMIRTPDGANELDIETPLRCFVNNDVQQ
jgi:hypothetical protein